MSTQTKAQQSKLEPLPIYRSIVIAADASDHSNQGVSDAAEIGSLWNASVTGAHVYAAKLHDRRFRQMEGGLPDEYKEEQELERQRNIHDDLITKGLGVITDSYLDRAEEICKTKDVNYIRRSLEGKNYTEMVREANNGRHDLLVMGAQGLGAVPGGRLGTVCDRVVRRSEIDTLVIKNTITPLNEGPILVAVDGSSRSYGGLLTALSLAKEWGVSVHVVSAYDPYYHYVAFNRIASVLSEEAGKVFRFKEQEKLHEDIIDAGLAKIYQGHLDVSRSIADEYGIAITTKLLDGKPHDVISKAVKVLTPSLLVVGKLGIHADEDLDIGGNAENLLRDAECAVLLSQRHYTPRVDVVAESTTSWTHQAEAKMTRIPSFAQGMARMAILRFAQERGHTVITESIVNEATADLCPVKPDADIGAYKKAKADYQSRVAAENFNPEWSRNASALLDTITDPSVRENIQRRAEKKARQANSNEVTAEHISSFIDTSATATPGSTSATHSGNKGNQCHWQASALARLARVPEGFMRDSCRNQIEEYARDNDVTEITLALVEEHLGNAIQMMKTATNSNGNSTEDDRSTSSAVNSNNGTEKSRGKCPFGFSSRKASEEESLPWSEEALARLEKVPSGFMRQLTRQRVEIMARRLKVDTVTLEVMEAKYEEWSEGSAKQSITMVWDERASAKINRIPEFVRGMVIKETERCAKILGHDQVTPEVLSEASDTWASKGSFHSEQNANQYQA